MPKVKRVLIVGAGMAGLTLAIALKRQGLAADMVERQATWPVHGAGIYLVGNAMRALGALNLADDVLRDGALIQTQTLMNHRGRQLAVIDTASVWGACGPCVGIRRADLQSKLVNALGEQAEGSQLRFSTTVSSIEQRAQGAFVRFDDGLEGVYDLVVGADGVRSSVRTLVFGSVQPRFCGQVGWRFLVPCPPSITGWTLYAGDRGVFLFIPVGHGQAYCYADAVVAEPPGDPIVGSLERLRSRFSTYASTVTQALAQLQTSEQIHFAAIEDILQQPWGKGNVLLIGDAAHATSPNMASGAAMAFEDALVLSELITSRRDVAQVLDDYTSKRLERICWVHEQTHRRDKIRNLPPMVRDLLTRLLANKVYRANYAPLVAVL